MNPQDLAYLRRALVTVIHAMDEQHPLGLACRMEAFYQHYARFLVMEGNKPLSRYTWWSAILDEDLVFAGLVAVDQDTVVPDAAGAVM